MCVCEREREKKKGGKLKTSMKKKSREGREL